MSLVLNSNSLKLFFGNTTQLDKLFSVIAVILDLGFGFLYLTFIVRFVYICRLT